MSFTAFSTTTPQVGEEQPLSSTARLVSSWTALDISAAFPAGKTPYSVKALIVLGADLPSAGLLGTMRVRKFGDTTSYEEAPSALGITSIVYRDGGEYQSGGFTAIITIPVDTDGKFEYQFQNDSAAPRTMIRILEVVATEIFPDATATPAPDRIPIADGAGTLDSWVTIPSVPPAFKVVDLFTAGASHTGDTNETLLHTAVVPAGEMGANGCIRVASNWHAIGGASANQYYIYFGQLIAANRFGMWSGTRFTIDSRPLFVYNTGATNAQAFVHDALWMHSHGITQKPPETTAEDTTQDVDVLFAVKNFNAGDTSFLNFALVEVFHKD